VRGNGYSAGLPGTGCLVVAEVPELGVYDVTATDLASGVVSENKHVIVRDWLIAGIGDSNASGEGNQPWQFAQCDRSLASSQYRVAQYVEDHDPHSSVTFLFTACSGAAAEHLWDIPYAGTQPDPSNMLPPQLEQVRTRVRGRDVDGVIMSIGINNLRFGPLMLFCIVTLHTTGLEPCQDLTVKRVLDADGFASWDQLPAGLGNHQTLDEETARLAKQLPGLYFFLARHLRSELAPKNVFITEYPDFVHDQNGALCTGQTGPFPQFYASTWAWFEQIQTALNGAVVNTAKLGWTPVTGIPEGFRRHGYCSTSSYFRRIIQAAFRGNKDGALHPKGNGQQVTYLHTRSAVCKALYGNATCAGTPPRRQPS
jgi:hypothetical protein